MHQQHINKIHKTRTLSNTNPHYISIYPRSIHTVFFFPIFLPIISHPTESSNGTPQNTRRKHIYSLLPPLYGFTLRLNFINTRSCMYGTTYNKYIKRKFSSVYANHDNSSSNLFTRMCLCVCVFIYKYVVYSHLKQSTSTQENYWVPCTTLFFSSFPHLI